MLAGNNSNRGVSVLLFIVLLLKKIIHLRKKYFQVVKRLCLLKTLASLMLDISFDSTNSNVPY